MTETTIIDAPAAIEFAVASTGRELVPVEQTTSLDKRAASINRHLDLITKADASRIRHRLRAGQELIAAREHVPIGEWIEWCRANIKARSQRDIQRLMKIAGADDPDAALEQERAGNRVAKASSRANATVSRIEAETPAEATPREVDDLIGGKFRPLGPRIRNTISVPEKPDGETRAQKARRLFLHFASEDIEVCNRIMRAIPLDHVDDVSELRSATSAVIEAWEKIDAALAMRAEPSPAERENPQTVPLYREDGVTPICNCELDAEKKDETRATVNSILHAMLDGEPGVWFNQMYAKSKIALGANMKKWNGWDVRFQATRQKTKAEIADFEAREKALHDAPSSGDTIWATIDDSDIAADPALSAAYEAKKAADSRHRMSLAVEQPEAVASAPEHVEPEPLTEHERKSALAENEPVGEALADGGNLSQRDSLVDAFLAKGGTVTKCPPSRRKAA